MGVPANAMVKDINANGNWNIRSPRTDNQVIFQTYLTGIYLTEEEDTYEWEVDGVVWKDYSTSAIYKQLKHHAPLVPWFDIIWCKGGIPKHNFLSWLFVLNKCPTRDRLLNWGLTTDPACLLCNAASESRDHLFFLSTYSWEIWSATATRCQVNTPRDYQSTIYYLINLRPYKKLLLIAWQCVIYLLWTERNSRLHRRSFRSAQSLL